MSLLFAELRKVWSLRVLPLLLALACANLLLLYLGTRPGENAAAPSAYHAVEQAIDGMDMAEKGQWLNDHLAEVSAVLRIGDYYSQVAAGGYGLDSWRQENAALFAQYEQEYQDKSYVLYTDDLQQEYRFFSRLCAEYDTVADYEGFLAEVQGRAQTLAGISIFQHSGYDQANIATTAAAYAGLHAVEIDWYPQTGIYTALDYAFTDLILLACMLVLALRLVRQERDSGLLGLVRATPGGRLHTALAKLAAFALSLMAVLLCLYGVNLLYCQAMFGLGPLDRSIQSVPFLLRCTMQLSLGQYLGLFLLAKGAAAFVLGLWVMFAALFARRAGGGWLAALALPLGFLLVRQAVPATSNLNVLKYANLVSLLRTNELLGGYRNLYWFGTPVPLPLVEWLAAALFAVLLGGAFLVTFARRSLRVSGAGFSLALHRATRPTTVPREEARKLLWQNGVLVYLAAALAFSLWQGVTTANYKDADELYYQNYMAQLAGPVTQDKLDWFAGQSEEFAEMQQAQQRVNRGELPPQVMDAYWVQQEKYSVYRRIGTENFAYIRENTAGGTLWFVYETGYEKLLLSPQNALQDSLLAGLLCALCFSGLFAMERRGGMLTILRATPLGRRRTVQAKLAASAGAAVGIALCGILARLIPVVRDYGLPVPCAPAASIPAFSTLPHWVPLWAVVALWAAARVAACLLMAAATLALGHWFGAALPALSVSLALLCLPPLLATAGLSWLRWLGSYPLFYAGGLLQSSGYTLSGQPTADTVWCLLLVAIALAAAALLADHLAEQYR